MEKNLLLYLEEINKIAPSIHILIDKTIEINGIKIHGSPITPFFFDWSWNRFRGPDIKKHWDLIPDDVQILVTHGPPHGTLDVVYQADGVTPRERAGCADLEEAIRLRLRKLRLHVFGHIHCSSGMDVKDGVTYVNASICDEAYYPANEPRVIEFGDDEFSK
jgi:Icc-related predicted phosphoesterase